MATPVKLFFIRHGETVDNVAQVYAGSRDSELTNHGFHQAMRLGLHFHAQDIRFTHFFSSHLQRAAKTASLIRTAQVTLFSSDEPTSVPEVVQLPVLTEQDFGSYEGKKWYDVPADSKSTDKRNSVQSREDGSAFTGMETKEAMAARADAFLDDHLLPLLNGSIESSSCVVAIVSHGIMLSTLWKRFLQRLPSRSISFSSELQSIASRPSLENLGGWSNTGYLELHMVRPAEKPDAIVEPISLSSPASTLGNETTHNADEDKAILEVSLVHVSKITSLESHSHSPAPAPVPPNPLKLASGWNTRIQTINGKDHLKGIKRTGGGVGSSRHDSSQKNIDSFFKRRKVE